MMDTENEQAHTEKRGQEMESEKQNEQISSEIIVLNTKKKYKWNKNK